MGGRFEDGIDEAFRSLAIDPLSAYAQICCGFTLALAGRHADAIRYGRLAVETDPESYTAHWVLQLGLLWDSRFAESAAAGEIALAISGRHAWALSGHINAYARWGKPAEARALHDELCARAVRE